MVSGLSWKEPLKIQQEIWNFIVITWRAGDGRENQLATYINGKLINSSVVEMESNLSKYIKLRGNFPRQVLRTELYLESGGLYDEVITWNRSLHGFEVRRAFQSQMTPYTSYKIRLWREDSKDNRCLGALLCRTKQGVPSDIQNLTIASFNSTSLLAQWSPPVKVNGIIRGYSIELFEKASKKRLIAVKGAESYLITGLIANTEYTVAVQGFTSAGIGPLSQTKTAKTNKVPPVTEKPKNVTAIALSSDIIKVTWIPLDQREEVQSYDVEYWSLDCTRKRVGKTADVLLKSLPQYTAFKVKVRGRNTQYAGPWEMAREVNTLDFDECTQQPCHEEAACKNVPGLYECSCGKGFTGDGFNWCEVDSGNSFDDDFCQQELFRNITWLRTPKGKTIQRGCPYGFSGWANRSCSSKVKASWHEPDLTNCVSDKFRKLQLQIISKNEIDSDTAVSLAYELSKLTDPTQNRFTVSGDLGAAVGMLELLDQKTAQNASMNQEKANAFVKNVVNVANNLLDERTMDAWQDSPLKSRSDEATKLLITMENIALKTASLSNSTNTSSFDTSNIVLKFRSVKEEDSIADRVIFSALDDGLGSKIEMPTSELQRKGNSTSSGAAHHIAFIYMKNIAQLLTTSRFSSATQEENIKRLKSVTNPGVISLSTLPKSSGNFADPVVIFFHNNQASLFITEYRVTYASNHCASFGKFQRLAAHGPPKVTNQIALGLVTYIGISISLISLVLAFVTFCSFGFLKSNRNFAHINLVLSLFLAELLFVVGMEKTQYKLNLVFLGMTLKVMATRSLNQPARNPPKMRYWVKACAVLTCLLGTTWLLGLFFLDKATVLFAYLFNIFNTLQGLFIFIFHCLADDRIRSEYKRILCCHGSRRDYLRDNIIAKSQQKYSSSQTTRLQRKAMLSEEKRIDVGTHTSSGLELRPVDQSFNSNIDITAGARTKENERLKEYQHYHIAVRDEEHNQEDNEEENSDDHFFDDISSSLINICNGTTTKPVKTKETRRSVTSDPFQDKLSQLSDHECDTFANNSEKEEILNVKKMGLMTNQLENTFEGVRDEFGDL
ncbi:Latrophilin-2 [Stylophora pistillata]|uniref:Latrophilin-2 n=1 Tax=Stylophora pistillata TaxID=50429 RepID=A0A2B4SNW3_STYPI|nr:Latrophilin-2 [Stylophora pistillata]